MVSIVLLVRKIMSLDVMDVDYSYIQKVLLL